MIFLKSVLILIFITVVAGNTNKVWKDCSRLFPDCPWKSDKLNTVCKLPHCGPRGKSCYEITADMKYRQLWLDAHNTIRNEIAGGKDKVNVEHEIENAADMNVLSYDLGLEYTAICHVHSCSMAHDSCRSTSNYSQVGQNLKFHTENAETDWTNHDKQYWLIDAWYKKERTLTKFKAIINNYTNIPHDIEHGTGHFTQLAWANTTRVGCAIAQEIGNLADQKPTQQKHWTIHITCNYYMSGNIHKTPIYVIGAPVSACKQNKTANKKYPNLCGEIDSTDMVDGPNPWRAEERTIGVGHNLVPNFIFLVNLVIVFVSFFMY